MISEHTKHQRQLIYAKYRVLRTEAYTRKVQAEKAADETWRAECFRLTDALREEIRAIPKPSRVEPNRESHEIRYCETCGEQFLEATIVNAQMLAALDPELHHWPYKLTALRCRSRRYCCYWCGQSKGEQHSPNWRCVSVIRRRV